MARGRRTAALVGILILVVLAAGAWFYRGEIAAWRRSLVVRELLDPAKRDAAWRRIVSWQRYAGKVPPEDRIDFPQEYRVTGVLECPQSRGPPLYAVFSIDPTWEGKDRDFALVRPDGTLVPRFFFEVAEEPFRDLNGDGILDRVTGFIHQTGDEEHEATQVLLVYPVTESVNPILIVAYNRGAADSRSWSWRLEESGRPGLSAVVLEQAGPDGGKPALRLVYRWSGELGRYEGLAGSMEGEFLRLERWDEDLLERFVRRGVAAE